MATNRHWKKTVQFHNFGTKQAIKMYTVFDSTILGMTNSMIMEMAIR